MSNPPQFRADVAEIYDRLLVPMIFEPYATDLAARVAAREPQRVLEVAAGTGVLTRAMDERLEASVVITATDLSPAMLERAAAIGTKRVVDWRPADALDLPFPNATFDVVVCQFGAMFFPDKARAFSEARRVLRNGGTYIFNVWDRIEDNEFADVVEEAVATVFAADPPRFLRELPHGYHDASVITRDVEGGGFATPPEIVALAARSYAESPQIAAEAYCLGTPLRPELEARDAGRVAEATDAAAAEIARRFGRGRIDAKIQAMVVSVTR